MNQYFLPVCVFTLAVATGARAEQSPGQPAPSLAQDQPRAAGQPPQMSEIPTMKQQGERMAVLMEQLSKESDPEVRRKIMAEAMCPQ